MSTLFISHLLVVGLYRLLPAYIAWTTYRLSGAVGIASNGTGAVLYLRIGLVGLLCDCRASLGLFDSAVRDKV